MLRAPSIDLADKQRLIALLIHSTMLCAAETWSWSRTQQIADLKTIANKAARMSLGKNRPLDRVSDDLLVTYGFIDISVFARLKRLRYFSAVLKHGPSQLRGLIQVQKQGKNCWREALIGDIAWARERMPECDEFPELSVDPVLGEIFNASRRWKGFLKQLKSRIADCSVSAGESYLSRSIVELDDERETFTCEECGVECRGIAKYKSHLVSKHRFRSILRGWVSANGICTWCLRRFDCSEVLLVTYEKPSTANPVFINCIFGMFPFLARLTFVMRDAKLPREGESRDLEVCRSGLYRILSARDKDH